MLCERCQDKPATVLITKIVNGDKNETRLCEDCAQEENVALALQLEPKMMLHNIFADFFNSPHLGIGHRKMPAHIRAKCEQCGFTDNDFAKTGKLGCDKCYDYFQSKIEPLLKRIHGTDRHTGKVPMRTGETLTAKRKIEGLKAELQQAIQSEEYERAAELRDRVKELQKGT